MTRQRLTHELRRLRSEAQRLIGTHGTITLSAIGTADLCTDVLNYIGEETMSQNKIRLAHIYLEQADVARQQSDLPTAIENFKKAIDIYKDMASEDSACWALVADTIERAAATYKAAGDLDKAKEAFNEAATLRETIAKLEARDAEE